MMQTHPLEKLFRGKPLYLEDKKEIENFFASHSRKKPLLFTKKNNLEKKIFEKYIKNINLKEFNANFFDNCLLFLKKDLNTEEEEKLKNFKILNYLIESIECESNLKKKLLNEISEMEIFKRFKDSEKKEFINLIINFSSEINAYNNTI